MERVGRWDWCWGPAEGFALPVARDGPDGALAWLERFAAERLPEFGPYEDAMVDGAPDLLHSGLSSLLNVGLLHPLEVVRRAERAYQEGAAPLASVEGFVRQVMGWREYVRGMYWRLGPGARGMNALGAELPLPRAYWAPDGEAYGDGDAEGGRAAPRAPAPRAPAGPRAARAPAPGLAAPAGDPALAMRCLTDSVRHVRDRGRAHHVPRLMVQANFATLLGVRPSELNRWFWAAFTDAAHWVTTPNVVAMGAWGDGGRMMTKPYVASGAYVRRMSDHCGRCAYDPARRSGPGACPITVLYWDFLLRHGARFAAHPRLGAVVAHAGRMAPAERGAVREAAAQLRAAVRYDAPALRRAERARGGGRGRARDDVERAADAAAARPGVQFPCGFSTTLKHPSFLSRNFRYRSGASSSPARCVMITDGSTLPCSTRSSSGRRYLWVLVWPILNVSPFPNAAPIGNLSMKPM
jgi:deoxyribodipyrimidine photolyase-related protein